MMNLHRRDYLLAAGALTCLLLSACGSVAFDSRGLHPAIRGQVGRAERQALHAW